MCCNGTDCESLFHSVGEPLQILTYQCMAFLGQTEERDSRFPPVRLLVLIKADQYVGWENLMVLKVNRLYLNKMWYVLGSQCSF